jgi:hypothetical protein|tara:strand:+ start:646 stop:870 length:225 start_codon:yes stop_codon:yes gene_type:complete
MKRASSRSGIDPGVSTSADGANSDAAVREERSASSMRVLVTSAERRREEKCDRHGRPGVGWRHVYTPSTAEAAA